MFTSSNARAGFEGRERRASVYYEPHADGAARVHVLAPGLATGIGSLPHRDAHGRDRAHAAHAPEAARGAAAPERCPSEGSSRSGPARCPRSWSRRDGTLTIASRARRPSRHRTRRSARATHAGLLTFLERRRDGCRRRAAGQDADRRAAHARRRAPTRPACRPTRVPPRGRSGARVGARRRRAADACACRTRPCCCSSTSPRSCSGDAATGAARRGRTRSTCSRARSPPRPARPACTCAATATCGSPSRPGPGCSASRCRTSSRRRRRRSSRHFDADGWIAWGAVPTDRPIGDSADALWRRLVSRVVRADPARLRPGAAAHARRRHARRAGSPGTARRQAERALRLAARDRRPRRRPGGRGPPHRRRVESHGGAEVPPRR